jgi:hypothetical protein
VSRRRVGEGRFRQARIRRIKTQRSYNHRRWPLAAWRAVSSQDLPFRFGECVPAVRGTVEVVGGNQLPASRTQTVVMDRRTVTEGDGGEQGAVP